MTQDELKELLEYDPETGLFIWKKRTSARVRPGRVAGCFDNNGYVLVGYGGRLYKAHRLAWLYMTGEWPKKFIDHVNMIPSDNRWENLREATHAESNANRRSVSKSGLKGVDVYAGKRGTKWIARAKNKYIGIFNNVAEAQAAYEAYARDRDGEFFNGECRLREE